ncbi:MurR/RpiR family transcriptional regulator [Notoacmeibacter sp. MSK16QG-6]|uniref:MurR/RpiR family transcriptional regulator n=1 Tax=Notoacmeibacter sp. MSK16QG-6 TaxID=2957982 RepID=UPI0020A20A3B|nr:MurR/RpiR family transcriptional regulator [Notoacmeibacter sp. MSK16QG-6]MCP1200243.1 MurR/RpiR family transcriptional regulator [Notoacmeibacter sp. MSK16QG-6]
MNTVIDLISRMRELNGTLPKREQLVADFVLGNLDQIPFLSQHEIAKAADVSVATVNRFAMTTGCEGFRDFKIRLAQSVAVSQQYFDANGIDTSPAGQLVGKVFGTLSDTLGLARSQLEMQPVENAVDMLNGAQRIVFFGVGGSSANVAREAANRFFRLGIASEAHADGYVQRMLVSTLDKKDLVFAISSSGQPAELLDSVTIAKQYGVPTLSLTKAGSELAALTDLCIQLDLPEDPDIYKPSAQRLVYTAIIDVLAMGTARKRPDRVKENLRRIRTSLLPLSKDSGPRPIGD